jgi:hypothetical protein
MDGFIFGVILGAIVTALALNKQVRIGFKDLILGIWERIKEIKYIFNRKKKEEGEL